MLKDIWKNVEFYCINHKDPVPMTIMTGISPFYACPKYATKSEEHPEGREDGERACANRLSMANVTPIIIQIHQMIDNDLANGVINDYNGMTIKKPGLTIKILSYSNKKLKIGILNRKAVLNG